MNRGLHHAGRASPPVATRAPVPGPWLLLGTAMLLVLTAVLILLLTSPRPTERNPMADVPAWSDALP